MDGKIVGVTGNLITAQTDGAVVLNSVAYCCRSDGARLMAEIIRIRGSELDLQIFEDARGLKIGDTIEFSGELIQVTLGPGLLGRIYDGLQNPLPELAEKIGTHLKEGNYLPALDERVMWSFTPVVEPDAVLTAGEKLGSVPEGIFDHVIMIPFGLAGDWTVKKIAPAGEYTIADEIAVIQSRDGEERSVSMTQKWPVKIPLNVSIRRLLPTEPLTTKVRIIDTMFPIVRGGTMCIPGPFGAGKTVLQHIISRHAEVDVVIVAACGERAGEVVELLKEFPELIDPRTGKSLMERTIIICNTSSMPVAAREASVYTAVTLGEYYRQMGLDVMLLADSTSRWAQALRELSGRLEEIPGEEAFPAYLNSRIANFYERAGLLLLKDGKKGSITIAGTVSPAGGNFEEPVTQGTLKVVGAFHGLSRARSDARRYPAIDPLDSWSTYPGIMDTESVEELRAYLREGNEIKQMMAVVGEEGTSVEDFVTMLKAEFFDAVYLQQNAFDEVDAATTAERQQLVFMTILDLVRMELEVESKDEVRDTMVRASELFRNWNYQAQDSEHFRKTQDEIKEFITRKGVAL
ncbi:MAG: V-type ATP synthase subunit A [Acidobacteria bacterium]|nr:V-type ATP synthase subunit A [Acidobacteriota bacterium]